MTDRVELVVPAEMLPEGKDHLFGGKAASLSRMLRSGLSVPRAACISTVAYNRYVDATGIRGRILLELNRKELEEMRWEEMWDASLRIRTLFNTIPIPDDLRSEMAGVLQTLFQGRSVVVRSSAMGEDASNASFAGIHESYVNVTGLEAILDHIKLVWASLWSDAALLYRKELGLQVEESAMAVVVQEMVLGERSGVVFGVSPQRPDQAVIEAVHGLNQGLVDGTVEPDRWLLDRSSGEVITHYQPPRNRAVIPSHDGVRLVDLPPEKVGESPLGQDELSRVFQLAVRTERIFSSPQDVEWTFKGESLYVLQSRPITTLPSGDRSERSWYLSLRRSFDNLAALQRRIEGEILPQMERAAQDEIDLTSLSTSQLVGEIQKREEVYRHWKEVYWAELIPFAHGVRLFGQVYNDAVKPADPFEFVDLLEGEEMISLERNRALEDMVRRLREDPEMARDLRSGSRDGLADDIDRFLDRFGGSYSRDPRAGDGLRKLLLEMAARPSLQRGRDLSLAEDKKKRFLDRFSGEEMERADDLLELAKASYRLRDDDNIYLGRIRARVTEAEEEARRRLSLEFSLPQQELLRALEDTEFRPQRAEKPRSRYRARPRQLVGQPAGEGIGSGPARVVREEGQIFQFRAGEVLVCDAVDPNMTFIVPLCSAIVERRGGMLIHGAIIAREYGIPCVTGIPEVMDLIRTGDLVTVDGYLGIVTINRP